MLPFLLICCTFGIKGVELVFYGELRYRKLIHYYYYYYYCYRYLIVTVIVTGIYLSGWTVASGATCVRKPLTDSPSQVNITIHNLSCYLSQVNIAICLVL